MKKIKNSFLLVASILIGAITLISCGGEESDSVSFSLSTETLTLNFEKGSRGEFQIITDGSWAIIKTPSFAEVSKTRGEGNATITVVSRERNEGEFAREDDIIVEVDGGGSKSIKVTQEKMQGCYTEPSDILLMSDGFAFHVNCGPYTKYFYWNVYKQSTYNTKSKSEVISEMTKDENKRVDYEAGDIFSFYKATANTQYVIVTLSYADNNVEGEFVETAVSTKTTSNQPYAYLYTHSADKEQEIDDNSIIKIDNSYYFCWYAEKNAYCKDYYTYAAASKDKFTTYNLMTNENFPKLAFYLKLEIMKNGEDHSTNINELNGKYSIGRETFFAPQLNNGWSFLSCAYGVDKYCQVVTWGTNSNGELSGSINCLYWQDISYGSGIRTATIKQFDQSKYEGEGIMEYTPAKDLENIQLTQIK